LGRVLRCNGIRTPRVCAGALWPSRTPVLGSGEVRGLSAALGGARTGAAPASWWLFPRSATDHPGDEGGSCPAEWCASGLVMGVAYGCEGGHRVVLGLEFPVMPKEIYAMVAVPSIDPARLLEEQLESASPDLLRSMLSTFIHALMSAEDDAVAGVPYGRSSPERVTTRNGYRHRDFDTRAGTIDVAIPKLCEGSYFPDWLLERRRRAEAATTSVVATSYLLGVSARRMKKLVETLGITRLSRSQVSRMAADLDAAVEAFRTRPLDAGPYTFVAADALVLKGREGGAGWLASFRDLTARGLSGVRLVTSDAHGEPGAVEDVEAEVASAFGPFVVLFGQDGADEADQGVAVGEDADDVGAAADLAVEAFVGVVGPDLTPDLLGERGECEHVGAGGFEVIGDLGQFLGEGLDEPVELGVHGARAGLVVDRVQQGPDPRPAALGRGGHEVDGVVGAAPLPGGARHRRADRGDRTGVTPALSA
jgi:hypothetical protein